MKYNWNNAIYGHVKASIHGQLTEPFINLCVKRNIAIWDIKRRNKTTIVCSLYIKDISKIKQLLKQTDCKIRFIDKKGFPFFMRRLLNRTGIIVGLICAILIITFLSNVVWRIDVKGADPRLETKIRQLLKQQHLKVGAINFVVPSTEVIETNLSAKLPKVTWIGVSKDGTTYHIDVVQKKLPKKQKVTRPRHLVAAKKAIIHRLFVEKGQPMVQDDQFVKKGQLLVSGIIGNENDPKFISSKGQVFGETWYQTTTKVPLNTTYETFSGQEYTKHYLKINKWKCPIWGFLNTSYKHEKKDSVEKPIHFLFWDLPLSYVKETHRQVNQSKRAISPKQALKEGEQAARRQLKSKLPSKSEIASSTVESKKVKKGILYLQHHFIVYENIAVPKSINTKKERAKLKKKAEKENQNQQ
ncbi:sporulation protein YqfD [Terrilactibacillus tamarindi]|nr:sporulation protein YqfD [Terrilactibacillus tamarindi]